MNVKNKRAKMAVPSFIGSSPPLSIVYKWIKEPKPNLVSKFFAEMSACLIFHFLGSVSPTPWTNGIVLMVMVYYTAKTSGAHLNPAVSLTFTILGYTNPIEMLVYWCAQVIGCILGALWIAALVPHMYIGMNGFEQPFSGCFFPADNLSMVAVFGWEAFSTFCFILPIFSVVWYTLHKKGYGNTGPLMVGLSLIGNALVAGQFTGAALNPARVLGSPAVFHCDNHYIFCYIFGELLAGALVPFVIAPWYGISNQPWYNFMLPRRMQHYFDNVKPNKVTLDPYFLQAMLSDRGSMINVVIDPINESGGSGGSGGSVPVNNSFGSPGRPGSRESPGRPGT